MNMSVCNTALFYIQAFLAFDDIESREPIYMINTYLDRKSLTCKGGTGKWPLLLGFGARKSLQRNRFILHQEERNTKYDYTCYTAQNL